MLRLSDSMLWAAVAYHVCLFSGLGGFVALFVRYDNEMHMTLLVKKRLSTATPSKKQYLTRSCFTSFFSNA